MRRRESMVRTGVNSAMSFHLPESTATPSLVVWYLVLETSQYQRCNKRASAGEAEVTMDEVDLIG